MSEEPILIAKVKEWRKDFSLWAADVIGIGRCSCDCKLDQGQLDIVNALIRLIAAKEKKNILHLKTTGAEEEFSRKMGIAIDSGKGLGKTALLSLIILWFIMTRENCEILCTAPKLGLLRDNLWAEVNRWIRHARDHYGKNAIIDDLVGSHSDKIYSKLLPRAEWGNSWRAMARTYNPNKSKEEQKATLQGYHAKYMLILCDESYGLPNIVYEPLTTTMTGAVNLAILAGNPTKNHGYAREAQTKFRNLWECFTLDGEKSSLVTKDFLERMLILGGGNRDSNFYRVNVRGLPPLSDDDALIPFEWIMEAIDRWEEYKEAGSTLFAKEEMVYGVDVGGGGDLSVICAKQGMFVHPFRTNNDADTMRVVNWVASNANSDNPTGICVDMIGIGHGVSCRLKEMGYKNHGVNVKRKSSNPERFTMLRDELFWRLRESFQDGLIMIPRDDDLISELSMLKLDEPDTGGLIKVTSKKKLMEKMGSGDYHSPNKADSLALSFYMNSFRKFNGEITRRHPQDRYDRAFNNMKERMNQNSWMAI